MKTFIQRVFAALTFAALVFFVAPAQAQNLAEWNFEGEVNTPSFTEMNITAGNATFGSNITSITYPAGDGSTDAYSGTPWPTALALDANSYLEFTIAPQAGYMMTLASFDLKHRRSSTGVRAWEIRSSLDNYLMVLASGTIPDNTNWHPATCVLPAEMTDLTSPVTFRIFGFNAEALTGTWRFDDVSVGGTVAAIPPPVPLSGWALVIGLILIASFAIIRYRRLA